MVSFGLKLLYFSSHVVYVVHYGFEFFPKVSVGLWGSMLCGFFAPEIMSVYLRNLSSVISIRLASF